VVTGDREWLRQNYTVMRNSILDEQRVVNSSTAGWAGGEYTFLDWRERRCRLFASRARFDRFSVT
jgi:hypothetical protein